VCVANALGHGFVEKVYENAIAREMRKCGLGAAQQRRIVVFYDDVVVGAYTADLLVEDQVIVKLKVVAALRTCISRSAGTTCGRRASACAC
jgi:GxxExxY protein